VADPHKPRAPFAPWDRRDLPGAFDVEESARRVGNYKWAEMKLFEALGGWVATVPELDVKMRLGTHCYKHAWHAELWHKRLPELREMNPDRLTQPANDAMVQFVEAMTEPEAPDMTIEKLVGVYRVYIPHFISTRFYTTREAMTPSKMHYVGVWQWDAYFHALAYRHVEMKLAQDQLRIVLDHQREDGMIPDAVHDEGTVTHLTFPIDADVTKPPLLAWSAWKLYEIDGDREFLDEIYEPIVRWNDWWFAKNDVDGNGLCEYQHPFSSGLDDSPLWDAGMPVEAPDLNTYLCLQQEALSKIAAAIGDTQAAADWEARAEALAQRMLAGMWDEQAGLFWARKDGQPIRVRTPFNLFPLITGRMPPEIVRRLIAHLTDPDIPRAPRSVRWIGPTARPLRWPAVPVPHR